ncbi:FAD-dependent monooxygenase [Nonomuraea sp. NPDC049158]|uniref:FAD-dependent monooxygenase n=1 Tax=Nonomuraea sp. NPDC049158 TaxID=3155649 RepID=UPI00340555F9
MPAADVEVLIVGGGLAGLSAAAFLSHQGVSPMLVERRDAPLPLPRARAFSPRTIELFRPLGLAEPMLACAGRSALSTFNEVVRAETVAGPEIFWQRREEAEARAASHSPVGWWVAADQPELESLIEEFVRDHGANVRYGTELVSFGVESDGVRAELAQGGKRSQVRAKYLVAADGYRAGIRRTLGVGETGAGDIATVLNIVFRADLSALLGERRPGWVFVDHPRPGSVLTPLRLPDQWVLMVPYPPGEGERIAATSAEACAAMVRGAVGSGQVAIEVLPAAGRRAAPAQIWHSGSWVADRFRAGPVLFAGDAAHVMQPAGGLGASTGIQDVHNLAWKLAAVLRADAGERLLDTYEAERRPVGLISMEQAMLRGREKEGGGSAESGLIDEAALVFGFRYRSAAVVREDPGQEAVVPAERLTGQPGTRAPHVELLDGTRRISTLDLFGDRFVLLTDAAAGDRWHEACAELSTGLKGGLTCHRIGLDLTDPGGRWRYAYGVGSHGAALVRPDGVVCWRSVGGVGDHKRRLHQVLRQVLARP